MDDSVEKGRELFELYYATDWEALSDEDRVRGTKRIGELLGYTEQDTAFFMGEGAYGNPIINALLLLTAQPRRWARKEVMLLDALHSDL